MKKHYIKHTLNSLQNFIITSDMNKKDIKRAIEMITDIRKELDKDDDK